MGKSELDIHNILEPKRNIRTGYSLKQLMSVHDKFKRLPSDIDPIPNILDKALGVNLSNGVNIHSQKETSVLTPMMTSMDINVSYSTKAQASNTKKSEISGIDMADLDLHAV